MEYKVPISSRKIFLEGVISPRIEKLVKSKLRLVAKANERICALSLANDDFPIEFVFEVMFLESDLGEALHTPCVVKAITQQMFKPMDKIPYGWKTFTLFSFPDGVPFLIQNLPIVDDWYQYERGKRVCLSSKETWDAIFEQPHRTEQGDHSGSIADTKI
jgi:hypothetical protein